MLDESVLALLPGGEGGFDPHAGLHRFGALDVINYSLLTQLVGRQKIERKGDAPAGDGGGPAFDLRERLDFVAHWAPGVVTDADGRASIEFTLPDNITGWRVLAMAADSGERFGLGSTRFTASLPTELSAVMPNRVRAGDAFEVGFAVRNRTDGARTLSINLLAGGSALEREVAFDRTLELAPHERKRVFETLNASAPGEVRVEAEAFDELDGDALVHHLVVDDAGVPESVAAAGALDAQPASDGGAVKRLTLALPESALPNSAAVAVDWAPSRLGALAEPFAWFRDYPHACWEQQLTRGVAAAMHAGSPVAASVAWPGSDAEMARMLARATSFQASNGGMAFWRADNQRVDPYLSAFTALALGWARELGGEPPAAVEASLRDYLEQALRRDAFPGFDDPQIASDVRAVALAARAGTQGLSADELARYERAVPRMSLFGKAQYLGAAARTPGAARLLRVARDAVLAHGQRSANALRFTDGSSLMARERLLGSNTRSACAVLDAWLYQSGDDARLRRDAAAMLAGIEGMRAGTGRWRNTQENLWCLRAATRFAAAYEAAPVEALVRTLLDGRQLGQALLRGRTTRPVSHAAAPLAGEAATLTLELEAQRAGHCLVHGTPRLSRRGPRRRLRRWIRRAPRVRGARRRGRVAAARSRCGRGARRAGARRPVRAGERRPGTRRAGRPGAGRLRAGQPRAGDDQPGGG